MIRSARSLLAVAASLAASLAMAAGPVLAQSEPASEPTHIDLATMGGAAQNVSIPLGKSAIVDLPVDARDVLVTNPAVASAMLRSPRRIYVMGIAPGATDAAFFDASGRRILALNIRVDQDFSAVGQTINRLIPDAQVRVTSVNNSIVLTGSVANASEADEAVQIAQQFTEKPTQVLDMVSIAGKEQVMLKVRIVEMQRTVIKQLGFNLSAVLGEIGSPQFMIASAASWGVNGALLGGLSGAGYSLDTTQQPELQIPCSSGVTGSCYGVVHGPNSTFWDPAANNGQGAYEKYGNWNTATAQTTVGSSGLNKAGATIDAFEQVGLVRTLAEPNLTAISGESAKFLAGGEFPVPTGISTNGQVSIEFKPFGVGLGFTPVVLSGGRISLKISTEVSELSSQGEFSLSTGAGSPALTIPGLTVRRAETTVELPSGGAMMIAGLLNEETKEDLASLPGMMNIPVLGTLFGSRDYQEGETELVVIVTPYLVNSTSPANLQTPADGLKVADDARTLLLSQLNKAYKAPPAAVAGKTYQGPVGYVIE